MRYPIYEATAEEDQRYALGTSGSNTLVVVGVNPHRASQETSDRTAGLVQTVAGLHGYDSFVLINLYPCRSRTVADLPKEPDTTAVEANRSVVRRFLNRSCVKAVWVAWGNDVERRSYLLSEARRLQELAERKGAKLLHFGPLTKRGHPRHPSRLAYAWGFHAYRYPCASREHGA